MQTLVAAVIDNDGSNNGNGNGNDDDSVNIQLRTMRWVLEQ